MNHYSSPPLASGRLIKKAFSTICLLGLPLLMATQAMGAVISWQTPTDVNINDATQVLNNGTFFSAGSIYVEFGGAPVTTVNGVTFSSLEGPHLSITASAGGFYGTESTPYSTVLAGAYRINNSTSATSPATLSGLTSGQMYQFQIWTGYLSQNNATRFSTGAPDGATNSVGFNESGTVNVGNLSTQASQFVVGTFTADATTQNFYYYGNGGASQGVGQIAAYSLRAVPEPQTWALASLALCAVIFRLRYRQRVA